MYGEERVSPALRYNLAPGANASLTAGDGGTIRFIVEPVREDAAGVPATLSYSAPRFLDRYNLESGDPATWNTTHVDEGGRSQRLSALLHAVWPYADAADAADAGDALLAAVSGMLRPSGRTKPIWR
jgi:hypothetical protein